MKYDNNENNNVGLTQTDNNNTGGQQSTSKDEQWSEDSTHCPGSDFEKVFTTTSKIYSISLMKCMGNGIKSLSQNQIF